MIISNNFPHPDIDTDLPVWWVSYEVPGSIHRFHHSSPISPSGTYLALLQMKQERRRPRPGEEARVVLVNLLSGTHKVVAVTRGWDVQLGAQLQWGHDDSALYFNDVNINSWEPYGVRLNPLTGERSTLDHTVYSVSPDGKWVVSTCLKKISFSQKGYGVVVPQGELRKVTGSNEEDGVYVTSTATGKGRMIISYQTIAEQLGLNITDSGAYFGFHTQWNAQSDRIMLVLRYERQEGGRIRMLLTIKPDGSDLKMAIRPDQWALGGNHPIWCPDGRTLLMNLMLDGRLQYMTVKYDGSDLKSISDQSATRGHPSLHQSGRFIITDEALKETRSQNRLETPLWVVDLINHKRTKAASIPNVKKGMLEHLFLKTHRDTVMRIDLHPAVNHRFPNIVTVNAVYNRRRHVFIIDVGALLI